MQRLRMQISEIAEPKMFGYKTTTVIALLLLAFL